MRLMGNMGFISWEFMTGELLNINWKKNWNPCELRGIIQWNIPVKRCVMP